MRAVRLGVLFLTLAAAVACGGPSDTSSSEPTSAPVSVRVVVDTSKNPCQEKLATKPGTCYLPIYSRPTFDAPSVPVNSAPASKCTPEDESKCWPQPNTELKAVCKINGTHNQDSTGRGSPVWYAVVVSPTELLIDRTLLPSTWGSDEVVGFAPEVWLRRLSQQELPSCEGVIAYG
jgi:hypothetical protein